MKTKVMPKIKVADEVWLATALLHRENPSRTDFALSEIVERVSKEGIIDELRPGVYVHAALHCVANRPPNPGRYRMLYETRPKYRRLFRPETATILNAKAARLPPRRTGFLCVMPTSLIGTRIGAGPRERAIESDPLLALYGSGKKLWADEHADEYVARLRAGWE